MSHQSKTKTDGKVKDYYTKFTKQLHNKATDLVTEMFPTQEVDRKVLIYFVQVYVNFLSVIMSSFNSVYLL